MCASLAVLALFLGLGIPSEANNVSYTYDAGGRLLAAFDGNGNVANYQYDQASNLTAIVTGSASSEYVFGYSPDTGSSGTQVTIYGNNFGSNPTVTFNGAGASVISSSATQIVVTAPSSTSGTVSVTTSTGTATGPEFYY